MIQFQGLLQSQRDIIDNEANREEAGTPSASLENSDITRTMEDMVRDIRRRVEDLEDAGLNLKPIAPIPTTASLEDVITRLNYVINIINEGVTGGKSGYV